jgi:hypothetical protein
VKTWFVVVIDKQKVQILCVLHGSIQAEYMDIVREVVEFKKVRERSYKMS